MCWEFVAEAPTAAILATIYIIPVEKIEKVSYVTHQRRHTDYSPYTGESPIPS